MDSSSAMGAASSPSQAFFTTSNFPLATLFLPPVQFPTIWGGGGPIHSYLGPRSRLVP